VKIRDSQTDLDAGIDDGRSYTLMGVQE